MQNSRTRKAELTRAGRAEVGRLYRAFLFPRPSPASTRAGKGGSAEERREEEEGDEEKEEEMLGAMYVSGRTRTLLYGLLLVCVKLNALTSLIYQNHVPKTAHSHVSSIRHSTRT